ncbi:MAG TPA: ribonuclease E inhibitor RraB [Gaiellaceae bacterium]|nr:ribonuclease E inhibitor RraB [Gaiellaceae bacterium]
MPETGTVTFFLYFDDEAHAEQAHAALTADGFSPYPADPPEEGDPAWSVLADREMEDDEIESYITRVRAIAGKTGGHLDGISTPWPGHPAASPPRGT